MQSSQRNYPREKQCVSLHYNNGESVAVADSADVNALFTVPVENSVNVGEDSALQLKVKSWDKRYGRLGHSNN